MANKKIKQSEPKTLNLALQGGGAHGAFTWGVLDYLLEEPRIRLDGICGTSAGSLNAIAVAYGLTIGDEQTARDVLTEIWRKISDGAKLMSPVKPLPMQKYWKKMQPKENTFMFSVFEIFTNAFSPYQFNPFNINPLRSIIDSTIDVETVKRCSAIKLFITATDVYTGHAKVFKNQDMTTDVILASACLPFLFQSIVIDGRPYWDGGYVGNPSLWPLFYNTDTLDLCVVHINPIDRESTPKSSYEITSRINEISFNSSLMAELRSIAFVNKLINQEWLKPEYMNRLKNIRLHAIRADDELSAYSVSTKFQTDWPFLTSLRDYGRAAAKSWVEKNYDALGKHATVDIQSDFLSKLRHEEILPL